MSTFNNTHTQRSQQESSDTKLGVIGLFGTGVTGMIACIISLVLLAWAAITKTFGGYGLETIGPAYIWISIAFGLFMVVVFVFITTLLTAFFNSQDMQRRNIRIIGSLIISLIITALAAYWLLVPHFWWAWFIPIINVVLGIWSTILAED